MQLAIRRSAILLLHPTRTTISPPPFFSVYYNIEALISAHDDPLFSLAYRDEQVYVKFRWTVMGMIRQQGVEKNREERSP